MNWLLVVLIGHFLNAAAFLTNKFLLNKGIPSPFVYAALTGLLGGAAVVLIPFGFSVPAMPEILRALAAGATFILALIFFYAALKQNEASRVVPLVGGLVPLFTFVLAYFYLGERLANNQILGFVALVVGGVLITLDKKGPASAKATAGKRYGYLYAIIAAFVFAVSFVLTKQVFIEQNFVSGFVWSRIGGFLLALLILLIPKERHAIFHPEKTKQGRNIFALFIGGQIAGALGFVLVNYAISLASVSLVNAMQGVQYVFLLIAIVFLGRKFPKILSEKLSGGVLVQKLAAIVLISAGIGLIAF
ncbi:MAG: DMT family transporter [Patescibacteria group bacterium]